MARKKARGAQRKLDIGIDEGCDVTPPELRSWAWRVAYESPACVRRMEEMKRDKVSKMPDLLDRLDREGYRHGVSITLTEGHDHEGGDRYLRVPGHIVMNANVDGVDLDTRGGCIDLDELLGFAHALIDVIAEARRQDAAKQRWLSRVGA